MIVVTAAGGRTGAAVVRALRARDLPVRAVVGRRGPRPELQELGAEVVVAELTRPVPWSGVLAGADALYLIWPNLDPDEADGAAALFGEARRAGAGRVVYHSVLRPQARAMPHHAAKDRAEQALDTAGVAWQVLQPCAYAQNLDEEVRRAAQSLVDLADVAQAAAVLLTEEGLDGGTFEVAGAEPLTAPRVAELLSGALDREVVADDVVPAGQVPVSYRARCRRLMLDHYRSHGFTGSPRVATALLGRPPRPYADHLADLLGGAA